MKKLIFLFLCILSMLISTKLTKASHIVGADISYKCVGVNTFEFTLTIYRDCDGFPVQPTYNLDYSSLSCNMQGNFTLKMIPGTGQDISPVCAADSSTCKGGEQPGIQQYLFRGTIVLPGLCSDWVFSWSSCLRNDEITNIETPAKVCMEIEATLNNIVAPNNNSPSFKNPPVSFICKGQGNFINPGTLEEDGDQLSFSTVTPKTGKNSTVTYIAPFSAANPITSNPPFSISNTSGDISIYPVNDTEVAVTAIMAEERRGGVLIGSVMRDMQFISRDCNNANPVLSGINNTASDSISICAGGQVCFNIFGSDPDANQKLKMVWNQPFDTAVSKFIITGTDTKPKANICWKTSAADVGLHLFTVTLTDNFCPITGSTTKSYKIRVNPNPVVQLPKDTILPCTETLTLNPNIVVGKAPFIYKWNSGELTSSVTKGQGTYSVKVTDANGCIGSDTIKIKTGVITGFISQNLCLGLITNFIDTSYSLAGTIVAWDWNFGDPASGVNNTSTMQNPSHTYATNKTYAVTLIVTDNFGCKGTVIKNVKFCDIPQTNFLNLDSCQNNPLAYWDLTTVKNCGIIHYSMKVEGLNVGATRYLEFPDTGKYYVSFPHHIYNPPIIPNGAWNYLWDIPPDTGKFKVTLTAINENGCQNSISHTVHVNPQPIAVITESSYYFDCSKPDTVLHGIVISAKAPFTKVWNTGETTDNIHINKPGEYSFTVIDANGCAYTALIDVQFPLVASFYYDTICEPVNPYKFHDISFSYWGKAQWDYAFDDGTSFSTTNSGQKDPSHVYPLEEAVYNAQLVIKDSKGCIDTTYTKINHEFPDNNFVVAPIYQCLGQAMNLESPRGSYIDSLVWFFGNGDTSKIGRYKIPILSRSINSGDTIYFYKGEYTYPTGAGNTYTVDLKMYYNDTACTRFYSKNINLFPSLKVEIDSIKGYCADSISYFHASQKNPIIGTSNEVTNWDWKFYYQEQEPPYSINLIGSSTVKDPQMTFTENGNYFADLTVKNGDGCELALDQQGFSVIKLPKPYFCPQNTCATRDTRFFYFCNSFPEVVIDSIYWDFGDGTSSNVREPFHIYQNSGDYNVTVKIFNTSFNCENDTTITVTIFPLPTPNFYADTVCLGKAIQFNDLSTPAINDTIEFWDWSFGDGETSTDQNPTHLYANAGTYDVKLIIGSKRSKCQETIIKQVTVRPNPIAGFGVTVNELNTGMPILFIDQSIGGVKWLWHYGDGTSDTIISPLSSSPEHTYNASVKDVTIEQIVYNQYNCTDTVRYTIDLRIYFILPNGFSPNGDGKNDGFFPTYKGIEDIVEFKVYDRWGQLVYDGSGNLQPSWDGKCKGVEQPVGVYVYYCRALAFNKEEIVLSGKVTLIR